ncbi:MAG: ABC transporter substrate-binding protein [Spirochaetes bacterium]|nr:ABC transporter substrate-binding protein [Spirochaetota bacterium]MBU1079517.1 ABC transporter substrate-binding protein [Spirochaetota bacterium]
MRMKSGIRFAVSALLIGAAVCANAQDAKKYEVTAPIKIEWWHALEAQYAPLVEKVVADFERKNPMIDVEAIYQGSYKDLNEKLIAAQAAGTTLPAVTVANTPYIAEYGASGVCEVLDPYIKATRFDIGDFGAGLRTASSYDGKQVSLPFLISTQIMFYNKDMADAEKIKLPETWAEMDAFMKKASKVSDGATQRYATVFPGWDQWYYETFFLNNGVKIVNKDGETTDLGDAKAVAVAQKLKQWCDDKAAYWAYGKDASGVMRQNFMDGKAFSVIHTTSLYNMYATNCKFKVGMHYLPGNTSRDSEIGGCVLLIPRKNSQAVKNAGWQLISYLTGKDVNMLWARETGYMPTRNSVTKTAEGKAFLAEKPAFKAVFDNLDHINPRIQHPAYTALSKVWMQELAKVIIEGGDVKAAMKKAATLIDEALQD